MELQIPISKQAEIFKQHLNDKKNERIIFSGLFGIGKSYFLNKYFEERKEQYITINLKPINYSISNNEDIFRLIKYDILYELIFTHNLELVVESVSRSTAYRVAFSEKLPNLIESFLPILPLLNKETSDFTPFLAFMNKLIPTFKEADEIRKDTNLNQKLIDFVKEVERTQVLESDFITTFIEASLQTLSTNKIEDKRLKVLVIDDLDRIDPEHIFRLFNIFSAHLDYQKSTTNKFGFNKIIFVCDIQNIRNIFSAKYGINADFSGYIDKFFSTEIFYFNNNEEIAAVTNNIIDSIDYNEYSEFFREHLFDNRDPGILNFLIKECISSGSLGMRRIKSIYGAKFKFQERDLNLGISNAIQNWNIPAIISLEVLAWIFGSLDTFEKALLKLINYGKSKEQYYSSDRLTKKRFAGYFIPLLGYKEHKFEASNNMDTDSKLKSLTLSNDLIIKYELIKYGKRRDQYYGDIDSVDENKDLSPNQYLYYILYESFTLLKEIQYFK